MRVADLAIATDDALLAKGVAVAACQAHAPRAAAWRALARACLILKEFADAEQAAEEANVLDPANASCWGYLALANLGQYELGRAARLDRAEKCLEYATQLRLADGPLMVETGRAFAEVDRLTAAESVLKAATELPFGPHSSHARLALARVYARQNAHVEAADEYATLLAVAEGADAELLRAEVEPVLSKLGHSFRELSAKCRA